MSKSQNEAKKKREREIGTANKYDKSLTYLEIQEMHSKKMIVFTC